MVWRMGFRRRRLVLWAMKCLTAKVSLGRRDWPVFARLSSSAKLIPLVLLLLLLTSTIPLASRTKDKLAYGEGLIVNIPMPESEVEQVVEDVAQNGVIRGTKEYNKDEFVARREGRRFLACVSSLGPGREGFLQSPHAGHRPAQLQGRRRRGDAGRALRSACRRATRTRSCASMRFLKKTFATPCTNPTDRSKAPSTRTFGNTSMPSRL